MSSIAQFRRFGTRASLAIFALVVGACSSGGSDTLTSAGNECVPSDLATTDNCGTLLVAVTDDVGDFASYTVDILSVTLKRDNGSVVETLPAATRVDFAQLSDLSDLLSAVTLAPGNIVGGSIRLDYSDAEVFVENDNDIVAAKVVDTDGAPLGIVDVEVTLAGRDRLIVTRGRTAFLSIDFDLAASHDVDTSVTPAVVAAEPYLVAEAEPLDEKELRVRGALVDVDLDAGTYDIRVRPWFSRIGDHGVVTVRTTDSTSYEIGDAMYTGSAGLEVLADLDEGTLTVAFGTLDLEQHIFTAEIVHAGDSLGGDALAAVHGNIVARKGDQLVVRGAIAVRRDRPARFHRTVIVNVGPDTGVSKIGDAVSLLDKDDLSVGQRIVAIGQFMNLEVDDSDPFGPDVALVLDATEGRVRMLATHLYGAVNSILPGQINLNLRGIDRLGIGLFDFSGTGNSPLVDADPADYEVATGALALDALEIDRPVRVFGFVTAFGEAPPDFSGRLLVGPRDLPAWLGIGWGVEGTGAPFLSMGPDGVVPDLDNPDIGERHHMLLGRTLVDLFDLSSVPAIVPDDGRGRYGLWAPGHIELFSDFGDFVDELTLRLNNTDRARSLSAEGRYDEGNGIVAADRVVILMMPSE